MHHEHPETHPETILRKECELPVSFTVSEAEREAYVLSGKYEHKPLPERKKNQIEVYGFELRDRNAGGGGSGSLQEMADHVEGCINFRVILGRIEGALKGVEWHFNNHRDKLAPAEERARDTGPEPSSVSRR